MKKILGLVAIVVFVVLAIATKNGDSSSSPDEPKQEQTAPRKEVKQQVTPESEDKAVESEPKYSNDGDDAVKEDESSDFTNEN